MVIKRVNSHLIDVFYGNGWENWARFNLVKNHNNHTGHFLKHVAGQELPRNLFTILIRKFNNGGSNK